VVTLTAIGLMRPRPQPQAPPAGDSLPPARSADSPAASPAAPPPATATESSVPPQPAAGAQPATSSASSANLPLTAAAPSESQLQSLLERWLQAKGAVLGGAEPPPDLDQLARPVQLQQLEQQRAKDRARGHRQTIDLEVRTVSVQERSPRRIALLAELSYRDATVDSAGQVVQRTAPSNLRNVYVFGRDGDTWRLAASRPAP
jgi:predicted lipid-binding transport protein (Tim44 family)